MRSTASRRRARVGCLTGAIVLLGGTLGLWWSGQPPSYRGQSIERWIDSLGPMDQPDLRTVLDRSPARDTLAACGPGILTAIEDEIRRIAAWRDRLDRRYAKAQGLQNALYGSPAGGAAVWLANRIPTVDPAAEETVFRRLQWGGALLVVLSHDPVSALNRLDALAMSLTNQVRFGLSAGFAAIQDPDRRYGALLGQRLRSDPQELRPFWIACLGRLGDQAAHEADYLRGIARQTSSEAQRQAILALAYLDLRPDTASFLVTNLETHILTEIPTGRPLDVLDPDVHRETVIALWLMGGRAAPVRKFLEDTGSVIDPSISVFARLALTNLINRETSAK